MTDTPLLDASGVTKSFGAVRALTDARLTIGRGEVVALMGANGAGKSTFVKILTGALKPDRGVIRIAGRTARMGSPAHARRAGLVPVYQEPSLIPDLDVGDNLRLGGTPAEPFRHWVEELGIRGLRMDDMIRDLPLATLRILDLARALAARPDVLLLDEMTAALPTDLVDRVLRVVREQADDGLGVIYVSHRFIEISELCDRASVLRDGRTVGDLQIEPGVEDRAVELMLRPHRGPVRSGGHAAPVGQGSRSGPQAGRRLLRPACRRGAGRRGARGAGPGRAVRGSVGL
jgi:ribose transport system ATP-binding protein